MSSPTPKPEKALRDLERLVRRPTTATAGAIAMRKQLPADLQTDPPQEISLERHQVTAVETAVAAVRADLRLEHLDDANDAVWHFVAQAVMDPKDHVAAFIKSHQKEPIEAVCYIPVEYLAVENEVEALGIRFVPTRDAGIPPSKPKPAFNLEEPVGCVAAVNVCGTDYGRMAERAKLRASHTLRVLRVGLREHRDINNKQLRFQLGTGYAFDDKHSGWAQREDVAYQLTLSEDLSVALGRPIADLPSQPRNDIERKALLALRWLDKAFLTGDDLEALLYRFFALEALLGDTSEGPKAHGLAFREMMLSHLTTGGFQHPSAMWFLYDEVRSGAVHGEEVPELGWQVTARVEWSVRDVLNQYLDLARQHGLTKRGRLLKLLDEHRDRAALIAWLRLNGGPVWDKYLDRLEWPQRGC